MTDKELRQYRFLKNELVQLEAEMEEARAAYRSSREHSVVLGSRTEEPYDLHPITVAGPSQNGETLRAWVNYRKAKAEYRDCEDNLILIDRFIDDIQDPQLRKMFDLHYRKGRTWQQVSLHFERQSEFWSRNLAKKYLKDIENIDLKGL